MLTVFDKHQLRIARQTLQMSPAMIPVMGGPSYIESLQILARLGSNVEQRNAVHALQALADAQNAAEEA